MMAMKVVIVGGVAGGATAAARIRRLDENAQIILTQDYDDVCSHCPRNVNDACIDEIKSKAYDQKVMEYLGLTDYFLDPEPIPYSILGHLTDKHILSKGHREKICGDCQWSSICND